MKKVLLISFGIIVAILALARLSGWYIFNRPGGLSGKPEEILAEPGIVPVFNLCDKIDAHQLNMTVRHAALLGYRDPQWLLALNVPSGNMKKLKDALFSCYQEEKIRRQKRTIRSTGSLTFLPEHSRPLWWDTRKVDSRDVWSFYLEGHLEVQSAFVPEQNLVFARLFTW